MNKVNKIDRIIKTKIISVLFLVLYIFIFSVGCNNNPAISSPETEYILPSGFIIIEKGTKFTKDCTPLIEVIADDAEYMAFSGDGSNWSGWIPYAQYFNDFNIADNTCGTTMESGLKKIYVRFKDKFGTIYPDDRLSEPIFSTIYYEMQELYSIKIEPKEVEIRTGDSITFRVRGYDLYLNEVPLPGSQIVWSKPCMVGILSPIVGLKSVYTAPDITGLRNISAHYGTLGTGAKVYVVD